MPILTPQERIGTQLAGKYRLERIVASGGMATVYGGVHEWTHRAVAVKILNYEYARDEEVVRRFLQEARAASQLKHPNVVDVLDMGRDDDGTVYLVMELLEGETLKARIKRGGLELAEIASLLVPVMKAVAMAHKKGVVHRDLKPDNVFLAVDDEERVTPKLLDFGIAKIASGDASSTRTGTMMGTPHYMAPEQVRGDRDVGPAADVWSMGVVLFACLSGRLPFEADSAAGVIAKVMVEQPPPLAALAPHLPPAIVAVVERALEREPAKRFVNMGEMLGAFEDALAQSSATSGPTPAAQLAVTPTVVRQPQSVAPPSPTPFAWAPAPAAEGASAAQDRATWVVLAAAIVIVAIAGGGAAAWWMSRTPEPVVTPLAPTVAGAGPGSQIGAGREAEAVVGGAGATGTAEPGAADATAIASDIGYVADAGAELAAEPTASAAEEAPSAEMAADGVIERRPDSEGGAEDTGAPRAARDADRTGTSARRAREPRRGTRGALILH